MKTIINISIAIAALSLLAVSSPASARTCYTNCYGNTCTTTCY